MRKTLLFIVCSFISICVLGQKKVTLEDIWKNYKFYPKGVPGFKSMNDGEHYTTTKKNDNRIKIYKNSFESGKIVETILDSDDERLLKMGSYKFNLSEDKILIATNTESIYRYSSKSFYFIYNTITKTIKSLSNNKVMYATFSPNGNYIAYVFDNNLYVYNIKLNKTTQITSDGHKNKVINGASDWVYEEEFGLTRAFQWSGDSDKIAYYKFNESEVKEFSMDIFKGSLYPNQEVFKYPKAGEENAEVSIHIYHIEKEESIEFQTNNVFVFDADSVRVDGMEGWDKNTNYEYFPRIKWFTVSYDAGHELETRDELVVFAMNRHQNELDILTTLVPIDYVIDNWGADGYLHTCVIYEERDNYYIDIHDNLTDIDSAYIWTSEKDGYNHIYLWGTNKGYPLNGKQITSGEWEVTDFHGIDDEGNIYYSSNESGSIYSTMYKMNLGSGKIIPMTKTTGNSNVTFSKGMKYYMNNYSDTETPPHITLHRSSDGKEIKTLEDNSKFNELLSEYDLSKKEFFTIETEEGVELNAWMMKPTDFNPEKEYPLYMFLYGGPGSQQVKDAWGWFNYFWYQHLNQLGYIVACVDNRGTGGKGSEFKKMTYLELGKYETIDQINAAKYFGSLDYIDAKRIGIQGWSYGGYLSSLAITKGADIFKMAIAVAPVTNWRYYDNIYTERYMRTPQENPNGYDENSPINHVEKLEGKYLLIHGSADDNVHVQNTMEMVSALVKANKQFDFFIYPDRNHGIYGGNTRYHLYKKMTEFILENL